VVSQDLFTGNATAESRELDVIVAILESSVDISDISLLHFFYHCTTVDVCTYPKLRESSNSVDVLLGSRGSCSRHNHLRRLLR
jgi:hypothetical protein